jgi:adenylosuccinate synthase
MPEEMKNYIAYINKYLGVTVNYISNGPGREQIISV